MSPTKNFRKDDTKILFQRRDVLKESVASGDRNAAWNNMTGTENVSNSKETSSWISEPTNSGDRLVKVLVPCSKMITQGLRRRTTRRS